MYNHDIGSTRYSALTEITPANVSKLREAWTFSTRVPNGGRGGGLGIGAQVVPIVINSVMYMPAGNLVVAAEADAGKEMWRYQLAAGQASTHGVAYWPGVKQNPARILFTLDAITGKYKWNFQTVHHDLWDFDNPPAPVLLDITDDNRFRALKITAAARANPVSY